MKFQKCMSAKSLLLSLILLFTASCTTDYKSSVTYQNERSCINLFKSGNYSEALKFCENNFDERHKSSAYIISLIHKNGLERWVSHRHEMKWLAKTINSASSLRLGDIHAYGLFNNPDYARSLLFYKNAAKDIKNQPAQDKVADLAQLKIVTASDFSQKALEAEKLIMVKFLKKNFKINARNKSFEETQNILHEKLKNSGKLNYKLALDYRNFKFTKLKLKSEPFKFYHKEFIYFKKAADLDHDKSQVIIAEFYKSGTHVPMSYKDSFNYYKKAALQNNVEAMANLGIMYKFAYGTKEDEDNTKFWLEKASKMGSLDAKFYLAKMYQEGYVVEKDLEKSLKIYKEIADSKESPTFTKSISTLLTAIFYYNGYDFDPNPKVSARPEFYQRRPVQGYVPFEMSFSLSDKLNSKEAILKALNYYNKSASKGNKTSIVAIANIYEHGTGVKKNLQLARSLYLIANNMSSQDAGESRVRSVMTQKEVENSTQVGIKLWNGMVLHNRKELYRIKGEAAFIN